MRVGTLEGGGEGVEVTHDIIKELVHKLRLDHLGDVDDDFFAGSGHPAGFGVGAAAAGEYQDARVRPRQGI